MAKRLELISETRYGSLVVASVSDINLKIDALQIFGFLVWKITLSRSDLLDI